MAESNTIIANYEPYLSFLVSSKREPSESRGYADARTLSLEQFMAYFPDDLPMKKDYLKLVDGGFW